MISDTINGINANPITVIHSVAVNGTIEKKSFNPGVNIIIINISVDASIARNSILFFGCSLEKNDKVLECWFIA